MQYREKIYDSTDEVERNIKKSLELSHMPSEVTAKLRSIYAELPDELPVRKKHRGVRASLIAAGSAVAALMLLFTLNFASPAFAESMPLVGGFFKAINERMDRTNSVNAERVERHLVSVEDSVGESRLFKIAVKDAYFDGTFFHGVAEMETEVDVEKDLNPGQQYDLRATLNGKELWTMPLADSSASDFVRSTELSSDGKSNIYLANIAFGIAHHEKVDLDISEVANFKLSFSFYPSGNSVFKGDSVKGGDTELSLSVPVDKSEVIEINGPVLNDQVTLLTARISPAITEIVYEYPSELTEYDMLEVEADGERVQIVQDYFFRGYEPEANPNKTCMVTSLHAAVDEGTREIVVHLMDYSGSVPMAVERFAIDLVNKTITPLEDIEKVYTWIEKPKSEE